MLLDTGKITCQDLTCSVANFQGIDSQKRRVHSIIRGTDFRKGVFCDQ
jgi:hypothetical protein